MSSAIPWPAVAGTYQVGDPQGPVSVCALTSEHLVGSLARLPGVAIAGKVYTANLGIARIVVNVTTNPAIRFLLLCGKDSPLFRPGQSLVALAEAGIDGQRQIIGAVGYEPVLSTVEPEVVTQFRRQVEVIDWTGEEDLAALERGIGDLAARNPGVFVASKESAGTVVYEEQFVTIRPGGQREPLQYDPKGYFVITLDREREQIVLRHYLPDHTPAHEMRGRTAGPMLLGLLRERLVTQHSHAGYLGEELAKAQAALLLGLRYDQDRPLRPREAPAASATASPAEAAQSPNAAPAPANTTSTPEMTPPGMPPIAPPTSWAEMQTAAPGAQVNVVLAVTELPAPDLLAGTFLEADEAEPFSAYRRTPHQLRIRWTPDTRIAMGSPADLQVAALVRARGELRADNLVHAQQIAVLTHVARIIEP